MSISKLTSLHPLKIYEEGVGNVAEVFANGKTGAEHAEEIFRLFLAAPALLKACKDLLGDSPEITLAGTCRFCGRDYSHPKPKSSQCESDDCPAFLARDAIKASEGKG